MKTKHLCKGMPWLPFQKNMLFLVLALLFICFFLNFRPLLQLRPQGSKNLRKWEKEEDKITERNKPLLGLNMCQLFKKCRLDFVKCALKAFIWDFLRLSFSSWFLKLPGTRFGTFFHLGHLILETETETGMETGMETGTKSHFHYLCPEGRNSHSVSCNAGRDTCKRRKRICWQVTINYYQNKDPIVYISSFSDTHTHTHTRTHAHAHTHTPFLLFPSLFPSDNL